MNKDDLTALVSREDKFSDEEKEEIRVALSDLDVADIHQLLIRVNDIGGEPQRELMVFLSEDEELYQRVSDHVQSLSENEDDDQEESE